MAPGTYIELCTPVSDVVQATAWYQQLGFQPVRDAVLTDGSFNLDLLPATGSSWHVPTLRYMGCDIDAVKAQGVLFEAQPDGTVTLRDPSNVLIHLTSQESTFSMPPGTPMSRTPLSRCGTFGEFAIPCRDVQESILFWKQLGYRAPEGMNEICATEPYPFSILSDGLFVIGLHQTQDFDRPHVTYFSATAAECIAQLKAEGIRVKDLPPFVEGKSINAELVGPGDLYLFVFAGGM